MKTILINDTSDKTGVKTRVDAVVKDGQRDPAHIGIKKTDDDEQIVFGEVYAPGFPDSQGDFMTAETIKDMAYRFMANGFLAKIDTQHNREENGSYIVESFIARSDDPDFITGSWVVGVKIPDGNVWGMVKSGDLNGFSLDGYGVRVDTTIELEMPDTLKGETTETEGHVHGFEVAFDEDGGFMGGFTTRAPDGHRHMITRGTVTDDTNGHNHRFSFVEGILDAQVA